MLPSSRLQRVELLVFGWIRRMDDTNVLSMNIPEPIYGQIHSFYPKFIRFEHCKHGDAFRITEEGMRVRGADRDHGGYYIYAQRDEQRNGYSSGVHCWSVQNEIGQDNETCFRYIGITTKYDVATKYDEEYGANELTVLFPKDSAHWKSGQTVSLRVDLDRWIATCFKNGIKYSEQQIASDRSWFFIAKFCSFKRNTNYTIVDTPSSVYEYVPNS